jgi:hypothetical protein
LRFFRRNCSYGHHHHPRTTIHQPQRAVDYPPFRPHRAVCNRTHTVTTLSPRRAG